MKTNKTKNNISQKPMTTMISIDTCEWFIYLFYFISNTLYSII